MIQAERLSLFTFTRLVLAAAITIGSCALATAHELRPAYLELKEERPGEFRVLWKTPMRGDARLALDPDFSGAAHAISPVVTRMAGGAAIQTWQLRTESLRGQTLRIRGLDGTMTDALVRIEFSDGLTWVKRLTPSDPALVVPPHQSPSAVALEYSQLGIEHILTGSDHLLFVLTLMLLTRGIASLIKTITAFTVAHSVTLALSALGILTVPQRPVEAVIALSIAFAASEVIRQRTGQGGMAAHAPWIAAFGFGLLHGVGFAGALQEIGLPQGHVPLALLFFNLGVEVGQLLFVGLLAPLTYLLRRAQHGGIAECYRTVPYAIGGVAMFWVFERVASF